MQTIRKRKIIAIAAVLTLIVIIMTISAGAFHSGDKAVIFGDLTSNTVTQGSGLYGGIFTEEGMNGFYAFGQQGTYYKSGTDDSVYYTVLLEGTFEGTVITFYLPYETDRYIGNINYSFNDGVSSVDYSNYVIAIDIQTVQLDYIDYDVHYNQGITTNPQKYVYSVNTEVTAFKVTVQLHETDVLHGERVPVNISYSYTDVPNSSSLNQLSTVNQLKNYIDQNQSGINTAIGYTAQIWSYSFIQSLIILGVLLTVLAILFNWAVSL